MRRRRAAQAEVIRLHEAEPEVVPPKPVDHHPRCQWVLGRREPACELEPAALAGGNRQWPTPGEETGDAARHLRPQGRGIARDLDRRVLGSPGPGLVRVEDRLGARLGLAHRVGATQPGRLLGFEQPQVLRPGPVDEVVALVAQVDQQEIELRLESGGILAAGRPPGDLSDQAAVTGDEIGHPRGGRVAPEGIVVGGGNCASLRRIVNGRAAISLGLTSGTRCREYLVCSLPAEGNCVLARTP